MLRQEHFSSIFFQVHGFHKNIVIKDARENATSTPFGQAERRPKEGAKNKKRSDREGVLLKGELSSALPLMPHFKNHQDLPALVPCFQMPFHITVRSLLALIASPIFLLGSLNVSIKLLLFGHSHLPFHLPAVVLQIMCGASVLLDIVLAWGRIVKVFHYHSSLSFFSFSSSLTR